MMETDILKLKAKAGQLWKKVRKLPEKLTLEPVMLLDGIGYSISIVYIENLQMDKICSVNLNYSDEICTNLSAHTEENLNHQKAFSIFGMWYGVVTAIIPLFFILFLGAWSDKYGRKPPLIAVMVGHTLCSFCYLMNSIFMNWPVEMLFLAAILDTMGGGTVSFLTACNAYISDVTSESERTCRVGLANSIWFLGGPLGTFIGAQMFKVGGYYAVFGSSLAIYVIIYPYLFRLPESRGPFSKYDSEGNRIDDPKLPKDDSSPADQKNPGEENNNAATENSEQNKNENTVTAKQMICDLIDYRRIVDAFRSTFRKREGNARVFILLLIFCNLLRRLGRGAYMYLFTKRVLDWSPTDYGIWVSYKNLISALGSLVAVPVLTRVGLSDNVLALIGALASVTDYVLYGLITNAREFFIWMAPVGGMLVNSCVIAIRSLLSKFVSGDELGKVSAVMGALDGVMPMISFSLYTLVYKASVDFFPGAQFFFGAGSNILCMLIFLFIIIVTKSKSYSVEDIDAEDPKTAVTLKGFKDISTNKEFNHNENSFDENSRVTMGMLASENFQIASTVLQRRAKLKPIKSYAGHSSVSTVSNEFLNSYKYSGKSDFAILSPEFTKASTEQKLGNDSNNFSNICNTLTHPSLSSSLSFPFTNNNSPHIVKLDSVSPLECDLTVSSQCTESINEGVVSDTTSLSSVELCSYSTKDSVYSCTSEGTTPSYTNRGYESE